MNILILHSRLSGYWLACMQAFVEEYGGDFSVVRKEVSSNAPFEFEDEKGINIFNFDSFSDIELKKFCFDKNPDLVYASGWSETVYLKIARHFYKQDIPVVCGLDNQWKGTSRQTVGKYFLRFLLKRTFSHLWIPGLYQYEYARKLGFSKENILTGIYSADVAAFSKVQTIKENQQYPHSLVYVGRFIKRKGLIELADAFQRLKSEGSTWSLTLIGEGPLKKRLEKFNDIEIRGFVQPENLPNELKKHGVFVLPSIVEPWGVVLHEAAAAGLPLLSTYNCGAATAFIRNGYNGYVTQSGNTLSFYKSLKKITNKSDEELSDMSKRSLALSKQFTPNIWASILHEIIANSKE